MNKYIYFCERMSFIIPFKLRPVRIGQGFNGSSHRDWPEDKEDFSYSVDFYLPEGTELIAAKAGTVVSVKDDGKENYPGRDLKLGEIYRNHMNEIEIQHTDGSFAAYAHLLHNGAKVKVGDVVVQGQIIALSGNTGWSSDPHLDFSVYYKNIDGYKIKTFVFSFLDYEGPLEHEEIRKLRKKL